MLKRWERWFVIGTDLSGRECRIAQVTLEAGLSPEEALRKIKHLGYPDALGVERS